MFPPQMSLSAYNIISKTKIVHFRLKKPV